MTPTKHMFPLTGVIHRSRALLAAALMLALGIIDIPALANGSPHLRIGQSEIGRVQHIEIGVNKSMIIDLPVEASEVIVSQPGVANAIMRTKTRAVIQGVDAGETNIFFLDARGAGIAVIEISVAQDSTGLAALINRLVPGARVQVQSFNEAVVLSGDVESGDDLEKAIAIAAQYVGSEERVTNVINVSGGQQVMLRVTVAEVKRDTAKELGINLNAAIGGGLTTSLMTTPYQGIDQHGALNVGFNAGNFSLNATLTALERRGAMRTLAEPVLTAISGQEADFLAGGEFPVPVGIDNNNRVSYEFKEFGVKLTFTPTVRSNGIIGLQVETSVSELTTEGALGPIPATRMRRASTSVEVPSGAMLIIGGLIEDRVRQQINALPGLGSVPILGALFRSREFVRAETELLILVTPTIIEPVHARIPLPTDAVGIPTDAEAIFLGRMENLYGVGAGHPSGQFRGSVGFVLD